MRHDHRVLHVVAAGLLSSAIGEEIYVANGFQQAETIGKVRRAVGVYDVDEFRVGNVELTRLLPEQMVAEEGRGRIQSGYPAYEDVVLLQHFGRAAGHVGSEAETNQVDVVGIYAHLHRVQEDQAQLTADQLRVGHRRAVVRACPSSPVYHDYVCILLPSNVYAVFNEI